VNAAPAQVPRSAQLLRMATVVGAAWMEWWYEHLRGEKRAVAGSWPGTISEARRRVLTQAGTEPGLSLPLTADELEATSRAANLHAKALWRARAIPEPSF
jgi:hypothetical protein